METGLILEAELKTLCCGYAGAGEGRWTGIGLGALWSHSQKGHKGSSTLGWGCCPQHSAFPGKADFVGEIAPVSSASVWGLCGTGD